MTSYAQFVQALFKQFPTETESLLHAAVGIAGESGELLDSIKKTWVYGKPQDSANLVEEMGDILFYLTAGAAILGFTLDDLARENRIKLEKRYPTGTYTDTHAQARLDKDASE